MYFEIGVPILPASMLMYGRSLFACLAAASCFAFWADGFSAARNSWQTGKHHGPHNQNTRERSFAHGNLDLFKLFLIAAQGPLRRTRILRKWKFPNLAGGRSSSWVHSLEASWQFTLRSP